MNNVIETQSYVDGSVRCRSSSDRATLSRARTRGSPRGRRDLAPTRGTIAVICAPGGTVWPDLVEPIGRLESRLATCPVAVWVEDVGATLVARLAIHAATFGVRAYLHGPDIDVVLLREQLTDPFTFPRQFTRWLEHRGYGLTSYAREQLQSICRCDLELRTFKDLLRSANQDERLLRTEFTRCGLGTPGRWFHMTRVVRIATMIQAARKDLSISIFAERYGFYDVSHLRHRLDDVIGGSPTTIRKYLGWEWMMFIALRRCRVALSGAAKREIEIDR